MACLFFGTERVRLYGENYCAISQAANRLQEYLKDDDKVRQDASRF